MNDIYPKVELTRKPVGSSGSVGYIYLTLPDHLFSRDATSRVNISSRSGGSAGSIYGYATVAVDSM